MISLIFWQVSLTHSTYQITRQKMERHMRYSTTALCPTYELLLCIIFVMSILTTTRGWESRPQVTKLLQERGYTDAKDFPRECEPVVMVAKGQSTKLPIWCLFTNTSILKQMCRGGSPLQWSYQKGHQISTKLKLMQWKVKTEEDLDLVWSNHVVRGFWEMSSLILMAIYYYMIKETFKEKASQLLKVVMPLHRA